MTRAGRYSDLTKLDRPRKARTRRRVARM